MLSLARTASLWLVASASNAFISPSGLDSQPCTEALPCASIDRATQVVADGDVIFIEAQQGKTFDCRATLSVALTLRGHSPQSGLRPVLNCQSGPLVITGNGTFILDSLSLQTGTSGVVSKPNRVTLELHVMSCTFSNFSQSAIDMEVGRSDVNFEISDCLFTNNAAKKYGGAITVTSSHSSMSMHVGNSNFTSNVAGTTGGALALYLSSTVLVGNLTSSLFVNNTAESEDGGAVSLVTDAWASFSMTASSFEQNSCARYGGAALIYLKGPAEFVLETSRFRSNRARNGGGLQLHVTGNNSVVTPTPTNPTVSVQTSNCIFEKNQAGVFSANGVGKDGAAIALHVDAVNALVETRWCQFVGNDAQGAGGGFAAHTGEGSLLRLNFEFVNFTQNIAYDGGGLGVNNREVTNLTMSNCNFWNNAVDGRGAGVYMNSYNVTAGYCADDDLPGNLTRCPSVTSRSCFRCYTSRAFAALENITVIGNSAICGDCSGGGIYVSCWDLILSDATLANNSASFLGGGIMIDGISLVNVSHTTFSGNVAYEGGSLYGRSPASIGLQSVDFEPKEQLDFGVSTVLIVLGAFVNWTDSRIVCPPGNFLVNASVRGSALGQGYLMNDISFTSWHGYAVIVHTDSYGCQRCAPDTYALTSGKTDAVENTTSVVCDPCPLGGDCQGGARILAKSGFWGVRNNDRVSFSRCPSNYCEAGSSFQNCVTGREGRLCGRCIEGWVPAWSSSSCVLRSNCHSAWLVVFLLLLVLYLIWLARIRDKDTGLITLVLMMYQNASRMLLFSQSSAAKSILGLISLDLLDLAQDICPFAISELGRLILGLAVPLSLGCMLAIVFAFSFCCNCHALKCCSKHFSCVAAFAQLVLLGFSSVLRYALVLLYCVHIDGLDGVYLFYHADTRCGVEQVLGSVSLGLLVIGLLTSFYLISRPPRASPLLRAERPGWRDSLFARQFRAQLVGPFKPSASWWYSVLLLLSIVVAFLQTFLSDDYLRLLFFSATLLCFLVAQLLMWPFVAAVSNMFQFVASLSLLVLCFLQMPLAVSFITAEAPVPYDSTLQTIASTLCGLPLIPLIAFLVGERIRKKRMATKQPLQTPLLRSSVHLENED